MLSKTVTKTCIVLAFMLLISACTTASLEVKDGPVPILETLSGDLPVSVLTLFPQGMQNQPVGYFSNQQQLDTVLQSIQADGKTLPVVDFSSQIVLFVKNTVFYNRLRIGQVSREDVTLTILAMETMSAMPIEDKVAISLAVIERDGAQFIVAGGQRLEIVD